MLLCRIDPLPELAEEHPKANCFCTRCCGKLHSPPEQPIPRLWKPRQKQRLILLLAVIAQHDLLSFFLKQKTRKLLQKPVIQWSSPCSGRAANNAGANLILVRICTKRAKVSMPDHASLLAVFIFKGDSRRKGKGNRKKDARFVVDVRLSHREFKLCCFCLFGAP